MLLSSLLLALPAGPAAGLQDDLPLGGEGPLRNSTFLPQHPEATEELERGDQAWSRASAGGAGAPLERVAAFDAWARALAESSCGDGVRVAIDGKTPGPWDDSDGTSARRSEGVETAVLRRLLSIPDTDRAAWSERFDAAARGALEDAAQSVEALAEVERRFPLTRPAALAALRCADAALEMGRPVSAKTWCRRARLHAGCAPDQPRLLEAISVRESFAGDLIPEPESEAWEDATALQLTFSSRLERSEVFGRMGEPPPYGRDLAPGATFLGDGDLIIQTGQTLSWVDSESLDSRAGGVRSRVLLREVLPDEQDPRPWVTPSAGGWPIMPVARDREVVVIVDRGMAGRFIREVAYPAQGNHLMNLRVSDEGQFDIDWHLAPADPVELARNLGLEGSYEWQPGPVIHEDLVLVQARRLSEPNAEGVFEGDDLWLFALERQSGELRWSRLLTDAADLRGNLGRRSGIPTTAMPLFVEDGVVLVGTNVGLVSAYDIADGRLLWSMRNQRRLAEEPGWPGSTPPRLSGSIGSSPAAVVTPFDSEFAYVLPLQGVFDDRFFVESPLARNGLIDLASASGTELWLGRDGRHRALRARAKGAPPRSLLYLDEGERFTGSPAVSRGRVLLATDRSLLLLDRERELYLLDSVALPDEGAGRGGAVFTHGGHAVVIGHDTYWVARTR